MKKEIQIKKWAKKGHMMVNVDCLDHDDPMHPYNQALDQGVIPEEYGIFSPLFEEFKDKSRSELINEIVNLRKQVLSYENSNFF